MWLVLREAGSCWMSAFIRWRLGNTFCVLAFVCRYCTRDCWSEDILFFSGWIVEVQLIQKENTVL